MTNNFGYPASWLSMLGILLGSQSVLAQQSPDARDLVPALVFDWNGAADVFEVAVDGSFPGSFRLPDELPLPLVRNTSALGHFASPHGPFTYAIGYVVAVPRNHPDTVRTPARELEKHDCTETACTDRIRVCSAEDEKACTTATLTCNRVGKDCKIASIEGDPALLGQSLHLFAGRASDVALLYIEDPAPAGSILSQLYAGGAPIASGYSLLERRGSQEEAEEQHTRCQLSATQNVLKLYNQELGVDFERAEDFMDFLSLKHYNELHGTRHARVTDIRLTEPEDERALIDLQIGVQRAFIDRMMLNMLELGCMVSPSGLRVVGAPSSRALTLPLVDPAPPKVGDVFLVGSPWRVGHTPLDW